MPEGPSLVIAREEMRRFAGRKVLAASGNAKLDMAKLENQKLVDIKTWGKHLLLCFKGFTIRIHFLMFGTYRINEKKEAVPRLHLQFSKGELNFYTAAVKMIEEPLDSLYDWTADVLSPEWDEKAAIKKLKKVPGMLVVDALLDQQIFSGVGNIIKNEVLYRIRVDPRNKVGDLPPKKLRALAEQARFYSFDFLEWKKAFVLKKHWLAHTKKTCNRDGGKIVKEYLGKTQRRTFYCPACQELFKASSKKKPSRIRTKEPKK